MLTASRLREVASYTADTGVFIWVSPASNRVKRGAVAGSKKSHGYIAINIDGKLYYAHRLAWMYVFVVMPGLPIDHIDGDRHNNRIANLRLASPSENQKNAGLRTTNKSGHQGVSWVAKAGKWRVALRSSGRVVTIGLFEDVESAVSARDKAYGDHGFHKNHGRRPSNK